MRPLAVAALLVVGFACAHRGGGEREAPAGAGVRLTVVSHYGLPVEFVIESPLFKSTATVRRA